MFIVVRLPGAQRKPACASSSRAHDRVQSERRALHQNSMRSTFTPKNKLSMHDGLPLFLQVDER